MLTVTNIILAVVVLGIVPVLMGNTICTLCHEELLWGKSYVLGMMGMWAVCQLISVPVILAKGSFLIVAGMLSGIFVIISSYALIRKKYPIFPYNMQNIWDRLGFAVMVSLILVIVVLGIVLQHTDNDDSRFVANAVDICRTNRMFLTNPASGELLGAWRGELVKDVTSPWAVFIAWVATLTGANAAVTAHVILPVFIYIMIGCIYFMLSKELVGDRLVYRSLFVCFAMLVTVFGFYSNASAEAYTMLRIWQGKAVVAGVGVPLVFLLCMWIYRKCDKKSYYILLFVCEISLCLLSGMGIIIGAVMAGCLGLIYGIVKKNIRVCLGMWLTVLPCAVFYAVNSLLG
ncbi:MAG: DUF6077 domain-containing protein [Clostridium sp.]|nr:DUF6077 domain-containing protein [Clostridium sp.]MCM1398458.1 DUF6077 domain-containing protein [Clostridium sp.]MCM1460180.1 DUF6077 domain-containing protein [Bacteroides sp.]